MIISPSHFHNIAGASFFEPVIVTDDVIGGIDWSRIVKQVITTTTYPKKKEQVVTKYLADLIELPEPVDRITLTPLSDILGKFKPRKIKKRIKPQQKPIPITTVVKVSNGKRRISQYAASKLQYSKTVALEQPVKKFIVAQEPKAEIKEPEKVNTVTKVIKETWKLDKLSKLIKLKSLLDLVDLSQM